MRTVCGIDFGTSNSTVGYCREENCELLALEGAHRSLPSAIFFNAEEQSVRIGRAAIAEYLNGEEGRLMRSLKSLLGSRLIEAYTEVQGQPLSFKQILSQFIQQLKERADQAAGEPLTCATFGRPVYFVDGDSVADRLAEKTLTDIASRCGFQQITFQLEPIAAAFAYEQQIQQETLSLIVDIGGGTSDFSIVRLSPAARDRPDREADILANGGVHLGGNAIDQQLSLAEIMPLLGYRSLLKPKGLEMPSSYYFNLSNWHTIPLLYSRKVAHELDELAIDSTDRERFDRLRTVVQQRDGHRLAAYVEEGKIALSESESEEVKIDLSFIAPQLVYFLTQPRLKAAVADLLNQIRTKAEGVIRAAGVKPQALKTIFFTGGASSMPILQHQIQSLLPTANSIAGDRFGSVGIGLTLYAKRYFSQTAA